MEGDAWDLKERNSSFWEMLSLSWRGKFWLGKSSTHFTCWIPAAS